MLFHLLGFLLFGYFIFHVIFLFIVIAASI